MGNTGNGLQLGVLVFSGTALLPDNVGRRRKIYIVLFRIRKEDIAVVFNITGGEGQSWAVAMIIGNRH